MRLIKCKTRLMFFIILTIVGRLYTSAFADTWPNAVTSNTNDKLGPFDLGIQVSYVAPYVWRGIPLTDGPCIQPQCWFSFKELRLNMFINMFGSNKDRIGWHKVETNDSLNTITFDPLGTGECSQSFGMINEINFSLSWLHSFNKNISLLVGYTQYAYGEYIDVDTNETKFTHRYGWFNKNAWYGEFTLMPSFKIGIFNLFTQQNFVLIAPDRSFLYKYLKPDPKPHLIWGKMGDSKFGSWHGVFGISIEKELSDKIKCCLLVQEEIANRNFFETLYRNAGLILEENIPKNTVRIKGAYQSTVNLSTEFTPCSWFLLSANCGIEFITKETISEVTEIKGAFIYGGVHTVFSFSW